MVQTGEHTPNAPGGRHVVSRRSVLTKGLAVGSTSVLGAGLLAQGLSTPVEAKRGGLTLGDAAILRFLAAAEILETDLWQQYNELGGIQDSEVPGGGGSAAYTTALQQLDGDMPQYIHDRHENSVANRMRSGRACGATRRAICSTMEATCHGGRPGAAWMPPALFTKLMSSLDRT